MSSLGIELPREMRRVRKLIPIYRELPGNADAFAIALMNATLDLAQRALAEGDVITMIRVYEDLKGFEE